MHIRNVILWLYILSCRFPIENKVYRIIPLEELFRIYFSLLQIIAHPFDTCWVWLKLHLESEGWSRTDFRLEEETTIKLLYDLFWNNEAETYTVGVLFLSILNETKELEKLLLIGLTYTNSGVFYGNL